MLSLAEVRGLAKSVLAAAGMDAAGSDVIADIVTRSERDGPRSHGLRMLPVNAQIFTSGYANGAARVPGDGRLKKRAAAEADGVEISTELLAQLNQLAGA